jgi:xylulokinase
MYLVGIDVGTTNTKAVIFDAETGQVHAVGSSRTITRHPKVEWNEFEADELWHAVVQSLHQAIERCDYPERIRAISVASMGEAGFPLDAQGNILYPAIAWYDLRSTAQAQWWSDTLGCGQVYNITGQVLHPMFGINKILWLREHMPAVFQRIHNWLSIEDFVLWKLSGNIATDYSRRSLTMLEYLSPGFLPRFLPALPSEQCIRKQLKRQDCRNTQWSSQAAMITCAQHLQQE